MIKADDIVALSDMMKQRIKLSNLARPRLALPAREDVKLNLEMLWKLFKSLIGKDLTRFSLPVFLNEPLSILQKCAELMCFNDLLDQAAEH